MTMEIRDWMTHAVVCIKPLDSVQHAREMMQKHRINQLPVVVDGRLVGIVTDRDVRDASPSVFESVPGRRQRKPMPSTTPDAIAVESVMSPGVLTLAPTDSIVDAARLLRRERIGSLPILEGDRVVGILTRSDLLKALVSVAEAAGSSAGSRSSEEDTGGC
jgi:acetoin utilization protein AcuB